MCPVSHSSSGKIRGSTADIEWSSTLKNWRFFHDVLCFSEKVKIVDFLYKYMVLGGLTTRNHTICFGVILNLRFKSFLHSVSILHYQIFIHYIFHAIQNQGLSWFLLQFRLFFLSRSTFTAHFLYTQYIDTSY